MDDADRLVDGRLHGGSSSGINSRPCARFSPAYVRYDLYVIAQVFAYGLVLG